MAYARVSAALAATLGGLSLLLGARAEAAEPRATFSTSVAVPVAATNLAQLIERALPAVVSIRVSGEAAVPVPVGAEGQEAAAKTRRFRAGGSGVIVNADRGLIATNHHVVRDAVTIEVALNDGREVTAKLIGVDLGVDIAMLQVSLDHLMSMPFGDSSRLRVGDMVVAIGNPFGLEGSASAGIISGLNRTGVGYDLYESFIQVDASINPGNSGGALINLNGELIGINTAVGSHRNGGVGIGFAIPINMAHRVGYQLAKHGRMRRGSIGLEAVDISSSLARQLGLSSKRGALVSRVAAGSPADLAGIKARDVIVAVNDAVVHNSSDFTAHFGSAVVGDGLDIALIAADVHKKVRLTVSDQVADLPPVSIPGDAAGFGGLVITGIPAHSHLFGQARGAFVTAVEPGSPAFQAGFRAGDLIEAIDGLAIADASQIADLAQLAAVREQARIARDGKPYIVSLRAR